MSVTNFSQFLRLKYAAGALALLFSASPGSAELIISQLVVEMAPSSQTADILVFNNSNARSYVSIEPREVLNPGTAEERRISYRDPRALGLLLSSTRLILEPQQKRLIRLAVTSVPQQKERIYRVTIKPVTGEVESAASGLKLLVGYEMLVMVKPTNAAPVSISGQRFGQDLTLTNNGTSSVELVEGKQCHGTDCSPLPSKRLYSGARWSQPARAGSSIEYRVVTDGKTHTLKF